MAEVVLYLVESSAVLAFLYLTYLLILRNETFFALNRWYLLVSVAVSLALPLIDLNLTPVTMDVAGRSIDDISRFRKSYHDAFTTWEFDFQNGGEAPVAENSVQIAPSETAEGKSLLFVLALIYVIGCSFCLSKTLWSLIRIRKMIIRYPSKTVEGISVVSLPSPTAPFSFFRYLFVQEEMVNHPEFRQILAHERTHIRQRHSIDLLFIQVLASFFWFNPVIWRLGKSLKSTHEYIADKETIHSGYSLVEYQTLLLKQLISNNSFGLVHNFNLSFIKRRITMMTNKPSGWTGKMKVAGAIICTFVFSLLIVQCNSRIDEALDDDSAGSFTGKAKEITLPVVSETGFDFRGDLSQSVGFTIGGDKLLIDGRPSEVGDIEPFFASGDFPLATLIVMTVDQDQSMALVRAVEMELRKADMRKIMYVGQSETGQLVKTLILLPPSPETVAKNGLPPQPDIDAWEAEGKIDKSNLLKLDMGEDHGNSYQKDVHDFVTSHINRNSVEYVVSCKYADDDTYGEYLPNLIFVKEAFYSLYQDRAAEMFGKDFNDLTPEEKKVAREGIPMNISIAEK